MLRILWTSYTTYEKVLLPAGCQQTLIRKIREHQLELLGHCVSHYVLESLFLNKIDGRRDKGRLGITWFIYMVGYIKKKKKFARICVFFCTVLKQFRLIERL